jgi:hypothetical protein
MREIDKSIQKKKQLKTTTIFLTLLVAVALVSSSAVTAQTTILKEKEIETISNEVIALNNGDQTFAMDADTVAMFETEKLEAPGDILWTIDGTAITGDIRLLGVEVTPDGHIWMTGADDQIDPQLYELSETGVLLNQWRQAPHSSGWGWRDLCYNTLDGYLYASVDSYIDQIDPATGQWTGVSYPGPITPNRALAHDPVTDHFWTASFSSMYYEFDSTGMVHNSFTNPWSAAYGMAWDDICGAPSLWVHDQGSQECNMHEVDPTTGTHMGTTYQYPTGIAGGLAMVDKDGYGQLVGMTQDAQDTVFGVEICQTVFLDDDIGILSINAPNNNSAFCPCTPVEVSVINHGTQDQVGAPVTVEIRRDINYDGFDGAPWIIPFAVNNMWHQIPFELGYPGTTTPRSMPNMYVFDSGVAGPGQAVLQSPMYDASEWCHPAMAFWMWHDEYGSDDYLEVLVNGQPVGGPYYRLCCPDCPVGWQEHRIDLAQFAGGPIVVEFIGDGDPNIGAYDIMIDDFVIYDQEYLQTEYIDIAGGAVVDVEFNEWCPCFWQDPAKQNTSFYIDVVACTELDGDEKASNDCMTETYYVYMPHLHDIASISIDEPIGRVPVQTFDMCGTIKNVGQYQECCFSVYMTVEEQFTVGYVSETPINEDFNLNVQPTGWTQNAANWLFQYRGYPLYEDTAVLPYYLASGDDWLATPPMDTTGWSQLWLDFDAMIDIYYYAQYHQFLVEATADGVSWTDITPWTNPVPTTNYYYYYATGIDLLPFAGSATQVRFRCTTTNSWYFDYYHIDNVLIYGERPIFDYYDPEYEDQFCVDEIDVCEELQICFKDWTPSPMVVPDCGSRTYRICMETRLCDPMDTNPDNNIHCEFITVDWWHDVAFKAFTKPSAASRTWIGYDDGTFENALGLTAGGVIHEAVAFTPAELGAYTNHMIDRIRVHHGVDLAPPPSQDYTMWIYTGTSPPADPGVDATVVATGSHTGDGWVDVDVTDYPFLPTDTLFVGVGWDHGAGTYPLGIDTGGTVPGKGGFFWYPGATTWTELHTTSFPGIFGINIDVVDNTGTVPIPDVYIPCGPQDICATFENLGTFVENGCTIDWELFEYMTSPPNPTSITTGSVNVDLDIGEVEEVCLVTYDFTDAGIYEIEVSITAPGVDCVTTNNDGSLAIGVDCCPPESEHELDPATPDGENNWYTTDVEVTLTAVDELCPDPCEVGVETGISEIKYIVNGVPGSIPSASGTFVLDQDGNNLVEYWAIDGVGNEEIPHHTFTVAIDQTDPSCTLSHTEYETGSGWAVDFEAIAADVTSGMNRVEFKRGSELLDTVTAPPYEYTHTWESGDGSATFYAYAYDQAGNSASDSASIQLSLNLVLQQGKVVSVNKVTQRVI